MRALRGRAPAHDVTAYRRELQSFLGGSIPAKQEKSFSEETAREIDCAVRGIVGGAFERTVKLLQDRRPVLEQGAKRLLEKETLNEPDLQALRESCRAQLASRQDGAAAT